MTTGTEQEPESEPDPEPPAGPERFVRNEDGELTPLAVFAATISGAVVANTLHLYFGLLTYMGTVGPLDIASTVVGGIGGLIVGGAALLTNYVIQHYQ